jgi:hypothetical protein
VEDAGFEPIRFRAPKVEKGADESGAWQAYRERDKPALKTGGTGNRDKAFLPSQSLKSDAISSMRTSERASVTLGIFAALGTIFQVVVFFIAITSSSYENPDRSNQIISSLVSIFVIWVSYVITVPVFDYMAVRSREIAERKD